MVSLQLKDEVCEKQELQQLELARGIKRVFISPFPTWFVCPVGTMSSGHIGFSTDLFAFPSKRNFVCFLSIIAVIVMSF